MEMPHMQQPVIPDYHTNPQLVAKIVQHLKINGLFDEMRKECLADIDTKPAFQNLKQRVEGHVSGILSKQEWKTTLNKNQLRSRIRESVLHSGILDEGVDRIMFQVFDAKVMSVFLPKISDFIAERGDEMKQEFMPEEIPPPMDMPQMVGQQFMQPPIPVHPEMQQDPAEPPPTPPPPLPESPVVPAPEESVIKTEHAKPPTPQKSPVPQSPKTEFKREYYEGQISPANIIVKAIKTPSPVHSPEETVSETGPVIAEDDVNPLRSLIQSLLSSKSILSQESPKEEKDRKRKNKATEGYSPTIDPSEIEAFTDDEEETPKATSSGPKTPAEETQYVIQSATPTQDENVVVLPMQESSHGADAFTPPSPYSPISDTHDFAKDPGIQDERSEMYNVDEEHIHHDIPCCSKDVEMDENNVTYDPLKFSYHQMSSPQMNTEDTSPRSPPSPTSVDTNSNPTPTDNTRQSDVDRFYDEELRHDTDMRRRESYNRSPKQDVTSSSSSDSSSDSDSSSSSSSSKEDTTMVAEVEETVEEIEVVEEYTSLSEGERSDGEKSEESVASVKETKKKKKHKKHKVKKTHKRKHSKSSKSSISSGEIPSSGELTSDSSSGRRRPTRPNVTQRRKTPTELMEMEDRRRAMQREEGRRERPFWANTESSSDYISSSPGRIHHPYSPPRRPYSPDFHRFENERMMEPGYDPLHGPPMRERHMYHPGEFRPPMHHPRFSPPYRRSPPPPHRYSPGPRMDFPPPFGSPRSPRRNYSPPPPHHMPPRHMMGGFPGDMRLPFPHPPHMHRYGSPPHPGMNHRRPSRSPPPHPGMRMEDIPGPSKHMRY